MTLLKIVALPAIVVCACTNFLFAQPLKPVSKDTVIKTGTYDGQNSRPGYAESKTTLWGYMDTTTGVLAIPYSYTYAEPFSEGWAYVWPQCRMEKSCSPIYIDVQGKEMLRVSPDNDEGYFSYYNISHQFVNGLAISYNAHKNHYGFINRKGKLVIPYKFDQVGWFGEGLAYACILGDNYPGYLQQGTGTRSDVVGYIDTLGNWVFTLDTPYINRINGCFFVGRPFKNGISEMYTSERGADCGDGYGSITVNRKGEVIRKDNW